MGNFLFMHHFKFVAGTDFRHQNRRIRVVSLNRKVLESYNITTILTTLRTTTRYNFSVPMYTWWKRNCDLIYLNIYISLQHTSNCPAQKILVESTKPFTLVVDNISIEVLFFFSNIGSIWKKNMNSAWRPTTYFRRIVLAPCAHDHDQLTIRFDFAALPTSSLFSPSPQIWILRGTVTWLSCEANHGLIWSRCFSFPFAPCSVNIH